MLHDRPRATRRLTVAAAADTHPDHDQAVTSSKACSRREQNGFITTACEMCYHWSSDLPPTSNTCSSLPLDSR